MCHFFIFLILLFAQIPYGLLIAFPFRVHALQGKRGADEVVDILAEVKLDALTEKVEKHNQLIERTYRLEEGLSVVRNDIETLKGKVG